MMAMPMVDILHDMLDGLPSSLYEAQVARFVIERGTDFEPVKRPKGVRKRRDRNCYVNAQECVLEGCQREIFRGAQYVEGYAVPSGGALVPIKHGWITLDGVHAVDVTWRKPGALYRGIVIPPKALADQILRTSTMGEMLTEIVCKPSYGEEDGAEEDPEALRARRRGGGLNASRGSQSH